jgi:hypothetical protein
MGGTSAQQIENTLELAASTDRRAVSMKAIRGQLDAATALDFLIRQ